MRRAVETGGNVDDHSEKPCSRYLVWKRLMKFRTGFGYRFRLVLGEPLQVTVRPMLWDRCPVCLSCLSVTHVGVCG